MTMPDYISSNYLTDYFRCPEKFVRLVTRNEHDAEIGYFRFGKDIVCYGRLYGEKPGQSATGPLPLSNPQVQDQAGDLPCLQFDPNEIVDNLRREIYAEDSHNSSHSIIKSL